MKWFDFKKFTPIDIGLLVVFIVYIVFPISTPQFMVPYIDSPIGLIFMFIVTVSLFVYTSPILGVLFIFVVYELLRRNHYIPPASPIINYTQQMATRVPKAMTTQSEKDVELKAMNPVGSVTLEEEVISLRAPVAGVEPTAFVQTTFHPVADKSSLPLSLV
jgi:hypothetical protein